MPQNVSGNLQYKKKQNKKTLRRVLNNTEEYKNCKRTLVDYTGLEIVSSQTIKWYANIIVTLSFQGNSYEGQ